MNEDGLLLYHERQESSLCGVHCLNTLLQAPLFSEIDLAALAQNLDKKERDMMLESGMDSSEFLRFAAEDSGNVAPDGNFSIQVLSQALEVWGLTCVPLKSFGTEIDLDAERAFICNLQSHWFTIRKVGRKWYNFNSVYPAPEHLSQFYLNAYLASLQNDGWTIFSVNGNFPLAKFSHSELSSDYGSWYTPEEAKRTTQLVKNQRSSTISLLQNSNLSQALDQGSVPMNPHLNHNFEPDQEDFDLAAAIAASLAEDKK